jgi:hypothetical protein
MAMTFSVLPWHHYSKLRSPKIQYLGNYNRSCYSNRRMIGTFVKKMMHLLQA